MSLIGLVILILILLVITMPENTRFGTPGYFRKLDREHKAAEKRKNAPKVGRL